MSHTTAAAQRLSSSRFLSRRCCHDHSLTPGSLLHLQLAPSRSTRQRRIRHCDHREHARCTHVTGLSTFHLLLRCPRCGCVVVVVMGKTSSVSALKSKSPAEFFAEHQNIAGFDNVATLPQPLTRSASHTHRPPARSIACLCSLFLPPSLSPCPLVCVPPLPQAGKSLYTTVREFVENSLDAAESIDCLPSVSVTVERLDAATFNSLRGITAHQRKDQSLYTSDKHPRTAASTKRKTTAKAKASSSLINDDDDDLDAFSLPLDPSTSTPSSSLSALPAAAPEEKEDGDGRGRAFFRVSCRDNGAGMAHSSIPSMLGVVLSSTKYGVKQTRGKFGLGAKMALVWSKKSTGLPIEVRSAVSGTGDISHCILDIDIHKNQPRVLLHEKLPNAEGWRGTEISVVIEGAWTSYRAKVVKYFQLLAVITPYADLRFTYTDHSSDKRSFTSAHLRRTDVMPKQAQEVKHHPSSVDNLLVERLIHEAKEGMKLSRFLSTQFSNISPALASRLISELGDDFSASTVVSSLSKQQIHRLTNLLKEAKFDRPSSDCLSPAGEYNLRLGIIKELRPEMVATFRDEPGVSEGHPFVVEAAVSVGGRCKPGLNIYRYANRIPLLFEGSNDVVSVVCTKAVKWSAYKMRMNTDRIGVYVSLVSSKVPFKGTSKEYIGDDRDVLHASIKRSLVQCCVQLRRRIVARSKEKEKEERKRMLKKYIPNVTRAIWAVLSAVKDTGGAIRQWQSREDGSSASGVGRKRKLLAAEGAVRSDALGVSADTLELYGSLLKRMKTGEVDEEKLSSALTVCVDKKNSEMMMEYVVEQGRKSGEVDDCSLASWSSQQQDRALTLHHPMLTLSLR